MALRAFLALHDLTREPRWLDAATQAAHYYATWIYAWHVPLPADDPMLVYPANRLTTGLSLIASDTSDVDSYAATDAFQIYRLYLFTGDPQLLKEAALMLYNTKQGLDWNPADPIPGFVEGMMNEALHLVPPRGQGIGFHLPWQTANYMEPLLSFQDVFGTYDLGGSEQHSLAEQRAKNHAFALCRNYCPSQPAPAAPQGLTAMGGVGQIRLAWNGSADTPYYILKRAMSSDGPYVILASQSATNYTDTTVTNEMPCFYVISALGAGGESTNSAPVSATPHAPPRLVARFSGAGDHLVLAWPDWADAFAVASTTNLAPPISWTLLTNLPYASNGTLFLDLPAGDHGQEFFRLRLGD